MRGTSGKRKSEVGLSEVVGFVMILGLIATAFSLYLTYSVPAQGRENEINHMNTVNDEFSAYKFSLDSLISNNQVGNTLSSTFNLGTGGMYTTGSSSILPVMSPVGSSASLIINQRQEHMAIQSSSYIIDTANGTTNTTTLTTSAQSIPLSSAPGSLVVNISGLPTLGESNQYAVTISGANWSAVVNVTPVMSYYINTIPTYGYVAGNWVVTNVSNVPGYKYNRTDITISVIKNGNPTLQNLVVYRNITSGSSYSINILDPAYGLTSFILYPSSLSASKSSNDVSANLVQNYNYRLQTYTAPTLPDYGRLGDVTYQSQNNYWIQQTYFYEMGGVFLEQYDGTSYKQAPSMSLTYDPNTTIIGMNVREIYLTNNTAAVSGTSPVLVKTTLDSITPLPYASISPNTQWVNITVFTYTQSDSSTEALKSWKSFFLEAAKNAGLPNSTYSVGPDTVTTSCYLHVQGNISLSVSQIDMTARIHGVGGVLK